MSSSEKPSLLYSSSGSEIASRRVVLPAPFSPTNTLIPDPGVRPSGTLKPSIVKSVSVPNNR